MGDPIMAEQPKHEFDIAVSTKLNEKLVEKVDHWAESSWRDRSKVLSAILTTVLKMVERDNNFEQDLNQVIRRLHLDRA
jgi:metal-responsive CopG/Arc/MetJ family transcriptional regulator